VNALVCLASPQPSRACRAALSLACRLGEDFHVTVLSAGPQPESGAVEESRRAGAKRLVHVVDPALDTVDSFTLGMVLAAAARWLKADLVLAGAASDQEGRGLVPAALAHHLSASILSGVEDVAYDRAGADEIIAVCCAGGQRMRLAFKLPVVLTVAPDTLPCPEPAPAATNPSPAVECLSLLQLGIEPSRLAPAPDSLGSLQPGPSKPEVVASVDELVARWLARDDHQS